MSSPPPPPPRRARPATGSPPPATGSGPPPPPPRRRAPAPDAAAPTGPPIGTYTRAAPVAPAGPTRAQRRAQERHDLDDGGRGSRRGLVIAGVAALVLILGVGAAFALGVFSGSDGGEEAAPKASTNVDLQPGEVVAYWPGLGPASAQEGVADQAMGVIGEYVDSGIVPGLRTGKVADADLGVAFDPASLATLASEDRGVVLDEGLPKAIGKLTITSPPVDLTVLNDAEGASLVVVAAIDLDIEVRSERGPYVIRRTGQLELVPNGTGGWVITGWDLDVSRTGKGLPAAQQTPTTSDPTTSDPTAGDPTAGDPTAGDPTATTATTVVTQ